MDRNAFNASPDVTEFLRWARQLPRDDWASSARLPQAIGQAPVAVQAAMRALPPVLVRLNIASSQFVPGGLKVVAPLWELPLHYSWKPKVLTSGNYLANAVHLGKLAAELQAAVYASDGPGALATCESILLWGGDRDDGKGAWPYLTGLGNRLADELQEHSEMLRLDDAELSASGALVHSIPAMNAMLAKVYSLLATDGLPIYDSRVAGALATIVEIWRIETGRDGDPLSPELRFPAVQGHDRRRVTARFENANDPGRLWYAVSGTPSAWAGAAIRAGWLLSALLGSTLGPEVKSGAMRAMEAALFMAGYDCSGVGVNVRDLAQPVPA